MDARRLLIALSFCAAQAFASGEFQLTVEPGEFTIEHALQQARLHRLHNPGVWRPVIELQAGTYRLSQPIVLRPEDRNLTIVAKGDVIVSGGVQITGWKKRGKVWVADVPLWNGRPLEFRQLWVNGRKAVRARSVPVGAAMLRSEASTTKAQQHSEALTTKAQQRSEALPTTAVKQSLEASPTIDPFEKMPRILSVDKAKETIYVPAESVSPTMLARATGSGAEMVIHEMWCIANLRIKSATVQGDSVALTFHNPESHVHFMHPWPSPMVTPEGKHNSAFYLTGMRELMDEPGEWWLDAKAQKLYYIPLPGEDMYTADVEAPALETLLKTEGTPDEPVCDITIEGITFEHATWLRPSIMGHAPLQAGMYMTEAYKLRPQISRPNGDHKLDNQGWVGRPAAAVTIGCAERFSLSRCTFRHTASTALDYHLYVNGGSVDHCTFTDIGGTAILAGSFGPEGHEAHLPYDPYDRREICNGLTISNNRIDDATNEDWGTIGIAAGFVRDIKILNNEISNVSYTGISLGWGWNQQTCAMDNNLVRGNYIHHYARHMYDTAGIYTLGSQPHTFIEENVVDSIYTPTYVHDPDHWFYLYTDEGSSYITVRNNWTPSEKFLKNANGPGNTWENNGPMVADSIRHKAGPQ